MCMRSKSVCSSWKATWMDTRMLWCTSAGRWRGNLMNLALGCTPKKMATPYWHAVLGNWDFDCWKRLGRWCDSHMVRSLMWTEIQLQTVNFCHKITTLRRNRPQTMETMLIHALVLFLTDKPVEAIAQLTALLKMDRLRVKILQKLEASAASLYQSGRWNDAVAKWGEVLQVFQFSQYAYLFLWRWQTCSKWLSIRIQEQGRGSLVRARILYNRATAFTQVLP